ncbi:hypothetical protein BT96DRAFT_36650 [Gymnopus androsaceus JB14]|uniref:Uncharacterized protein n=1 Tax=Gymnopus androsaceus JB14 TaxID=1447944 RepID=A0A6A4HMX9_9AGAR|nr:hypothetical protein BT96DRAFT_36650 [Gymnopus androsaceus JB14]
MQLKLVSFLIATAIVASASPILLPTSGGLVERGYTSWGNSTQKLFNPLKSNPHSQCEDDDVLCLDWKAAGLLEVEDDLGVDAGVDNVLDVNVKTRSLLGLDLRVRASRPGLLGAV